MIDFDPALVPPSKFTSGLFLFKDYYYMITMTTGQAIKQKLGLEKLKYVSITRVLLTAYKVYFIVYDSLRPAHPVTSHRFFHGYMPSSMAAYPFTERPKFTPLLDLDEFNGTLRSAMFFTIDLAGQYANERNLAGWLESKDKLKTNYFFGCLKEFITIKDLGDTGNISGLTQTWRKDRTRTMGGENTTAKIIDAFIEEGDNSVTFVFSTPATELNGKPPNEDIESTYKFYNTPKGEVNRNTFDIKKNQIKRYIIHIKILEFFDWLKTNPDLKEIKPKDIKEILEVSNVQVWSNSPSFHFQGFNYWLSQLDGSIYSTDIAPKRWNASNLHGDGQAFTDKHVYGLIRQMPFFENPMASLLTSKLKRLGYLE